MRVIVATIAAVVVMAGLVGGAYGTSTTPPLNLKYSKASALPSGSRFLKVPGGSWDGGGLSASATTMDVGTAAGIQQVDAKSNTFKPRLLSGKEADGIAYYQGRIWASDYDGNVVRAVDEAKGTVVATVSLPQFASPEDVVAAAGSIWVAEHHLGAVAQINPVSGKIVASVTVASIGSDGPQGLSYGAGSLWVSAPNVGQVVRIDPTNRHILARIRIPAPMSPCSTIAVGTTSAWVTDCLDDTLVARISLATNKVARVIDMHGRSIEPVAQGDTAWFLIGRDPDNQSMKQQHAYLVQLSSTDRVLRRYDLGPRFTPGGAAIAFGSLWASSFTTPWVARIPLT